MPSRAHLSILALACAAACASETRRFPLRDPMWRDSDLDSRSVPCRDEGGRRVCRPAPYQSWLAWDGADNQAFRPLARFFAVDLGGAAVNVNSVDEVPDSSWFENRIGRRWMSPADAALGACAGAPPLEVEVADDSWLIDSGKPNGANPGFRVRLPDGRRYLLKSDRVQGERTTAAAAIATRLYHAAGFHVPCERVVYVRREVLRLQPGLSSTDNLGVRRPFDEAALDRLLAAAARRGERYRFVASEWLPGQALGPFRYVGTRHDDPGDVIPHEDRRDLRGSRLLAAWVNHFDSREQNSLAVWLADDPARPESSPGFVRHYLIDFGDCFGSQWPDEIWRRLGHAHYFDIEYIFADLFTFGFVERPWDRARLSRGGVFGYYSARDFDPERWRGGYPNPTFARMTEADGAWAARIISRFTDAHLAAIVATGDLTDPDDAGFLYTQLRERRDVIVRRYLSRLSPLSDVTAAGRRVCAVDLARRSAAFAGARFRYAARVADGPALPLAVDGHGWVCATLPRVARDGSYRVVELHNGQAEGWLRVHLYDLGAAGGLRVAGVERAEVSE